ncbi:MAG: ABC transporter permease [Halanaerobium sp.]|nr:ABC transporter permease [Halanaerobium sp.]
MIDILTNPQLWASTLAMGTPIALGALGGTFSEKTGVVNIAIEGTMLTSAFFAVFFANYFNNAWMGLLGAVIVGLILSLIYAWGAINLAADQIVLGMAVNIIAAGLTTYLLNNIYGYMGTPTDTPSLPYVSIPFVKDIPFIGQVLDGQSVIFYMSVILVLLSHWLFYHTNLGLRLRSVGENPEAVATAGLSVFKLRYIGVAIGGMVSALGGAFLSIGVLNGFEVNLTNGRGYIALAAMIFGKWTPLGAYGTAMLFGFATVLSMFLQNYGISQDLVQMLPYLLTIFALVGIGVNSVPPAADGEPFELEG